ncbi:hypothetical protein J6590_035173 [Homalodisca vitripennis]|nr:hypothetical protein J6590_035173 [Homalodisca vitripennis]
MVDDPDSAGLHHTTELTQAHLSHTYTQQLFGVWCARIATHRNYSHTRLVRRTRLLVIDTPLSFYNIRDSIMIAVRGLETTTVASCENLKHFVVSVMYLSRDNCDSLCLKAMHKHEKLRAHATDEQMEMNVFYR